MQVAHPQIELARSISDKVAFKFLKTQDTLSMRRVHELYQYKPLYTGRYH